MKSYTKNIALIILYVFSINIGLYSQKSLLKRIDSVHVDNFALMQNTADGGWITATSSPTFNPNTSTKGLLIIKYSKCSTIEWSKYYYFDVTNFNCADILLDPNGNIMITGYACYYDACKIYIVNLSSDGNVIWCKSINPSQYGIAYSIGKTSDGNYFLYGMIDDINAYLPQNYLLKFNSAGNVIWSYKYYANPIWGEAIAVESGNILIRSGNIIYKVNSSGMLLWGKRFIGLQYTSKPLISNDGYTYINYPSSLSDSTCFLFKINIDGNLLFTSNSFKGNRMGKIKKLNNGNYLMIGGYGDNNGNGNVNLIECTSNGNIVNQRLIDNLGAGSINRGCDFITLNDNSLVISAKSDATENLFLIKTDENQNALCGEININQTYTAPNLNVIDEPEFANTYTVQLSNVNFQKTDISLNETSYCYIPDIMNLELGNDTTLCAGSSLILKSNINGNYSYLWSTGETTSQIFVSSAGTYWLRVIGCDTVSDTIKVNYTPGLTINYKIYPLSVDLGHSIEFTNNTNGFLSYYWETGDGNIYLQNHFEHIYQNSGFFYPVIHFIDSFYCSYSEITKVEIRFATLYIPNSFSPNGDGLNEIFDIKGEAIKTYTLYIYNRWGQLIYTAQNMGWDGSSFGNPCQLGIYNYKAEIIDIFGRFSERKGQIILIR